MTPVIDAKIDFNRDVTRNDVDKVGRVFVGCALILCGDDRRIHESQFAVAIHYREIIVPTEHRIAFLEKNGRIWERFTVNDELFERSAIDPREMEASNSA